MEQSGETFKGKLSVLDDALERFAKKHHTQVAAPKSTYYPPVENSDSLENREISWMDGPIAKAILIQPHQTATERKSDAWDFCILAWIKDAQTWEKPHLRFLLLRNAGINTLTSKIEDLLSQAEQKLNDIKPEDIK